MKGNELDFMLLSGLKNRPVLRWVQQHDLQEEILRRRELLRNVSPSPSLEEWITVTPASTLDLIASFQHTVIGGISCAGRFCRRTGARTESIIIFGRSCCECRTARRIAAIRELPVSFFLAGALDRQRGDDCGCGFLKELRGRSEVSSWISESTS